MKSMIRELREAKGMTQEELAAQSKISRTTISFLENNVEKDTLAGTLFAIAAVLDTTIDKLFFDEND